MDRKTRVRISKRMSLALRHDPSSLGLTLDTAGWATLSALVAGLRQRGETIDIDDVLEAVRTSDKQRFALSTNGERIRANHGHSVDVDLGLAPTTPPSTLFHGTSESTLGAIESQGLLPMARRHVHLSADRSTARTVASRRRGAIVILRIDAGAMHGDGIEFYRSDNGVWLTSTVPPKYLAREE